MRDAKRSALTKGNAVRALLAPKYRKQASMAGSKERDEANQQARGIQKGMTLFVKRESGLASSGRMYIFEASDRRISSSGKTAASAASSS